MPVVTAAVSPTAVSLQTKQLGDDNTAGVFIQPVLDSAGSPSKVTLFGPSTATASGLQTSGFQNTAVTRGQAGGLVATYATTATPAAIATLTSAEVTLTPSIGTNPVVTITNTDIVVLNKPTSQAGLGYGNVRYATASTIALSFHNITGGTLTPTTTQIYGVVALRNTNTNGANATTITITPTAVTTKTTAEQQFTVSGLRVGELVMVNKPTTNAGLDIVGARVVSNNLLGITFANFTAGTLTPTAGEAYLVQSLGGLDAASNFVAAQIPVIGGTVVTVSATDITVTCAAANLGVQTQVIGVNKPTLQAGLLCGGGRVASSTTLAVTFVNPTAGTLTPTAAEVLTFGLSQANPPAPLIVYAVTITPASVATLTTAEQTFVVTGLVSGSPVWVNKPSVQPGLGIVGARVSSANNVAINYLNTTGGTLTPASETYIIGNFQMPIDTTTANSWVQPAVGALQANSVLNNANRAALVNLAAMAAS